MSYAATIPGANSTIGTGNNAPTNASDASFRGWTQMVANGFISAGWARAIDTGNINFTTVSTPAVASVAQGYDIFKMQDTLQNTAPVFVKVEYGAGSTNTFPSLWITIGSGSNGAGMLTGPLSLRRQININSPASTNAITSFISGDANRIGMALWHFSNTTFGNTVCIGPQSIYFSIERTKDASGADTNEGVLFVGRTNVSAAIVGTQQYWNSATGPTGLEDWGVLLPTVNIGLTTGVQTAFYPIYHSKGVFLNPGMGTLCFAVSTSAGTTIPATEGAPIVIPIYGNNHTYMPMSPTLANTVGLRGGANSSFCMRYE
jgi:hypothetical protein